MASPPAPDATLRVAIVDDEPLARDCMRLALRGMPDVAVVAECANGIEAVAAIERHAPDVVLLDVQMPGLDGFGVIETVGADEMPLVVFVTAFDAHAIRAFEVHAMDYVLKPFADERFLAAVERARSAVRERRQLELGRRLAALVRDWPSSADAERGLGGAAAEPPRPAHGPVAVEPRARPARFTVREDGRVRFVAAADVEWIEADGNYVVLHAGGTRHRVRGTIAGVMEELDPATFVRVHRSTIVNVGRIRELQPWFGGDYIAILDGGVKVRVSRTRVGELLGGTHR